MPKILNIRLANLTASISTELVKFDEKGIGEIKSEDIFKEALKLDNFFPVEEAKDEKPAKKVVEEKAEETKVEAKDEQEEKEEKEAKKPAPRKSMAKK